MKKFIFTLLTLVGVALSVDVSDDFDRANEQLSSGNWVKPTGRDEPFSIVSNQMTGNGGTFETYGSMWVGNSFNANHEAQIMVVSIPAGQQLSMGLFGENPYNTNTGYRAVIFNDSCQIRKGGTAVASKTSGYTLSASDSILFRCYGDTLYLFKNNELMLKYRDTDYRTGNPFFNDYPTSGYFVADNFRARDYTPPVTCDTIDTLTKVDSTTTTATVRCLLPCSTPPDSVQLVYGNTAATISDTINIATIDSAQFDTVVYTLTGLNPSDSLYYKWKWKTFITPTQFTFLADSIDTVFIDPCLIASTIDSIINVIDGKLDSGQVGDFVVVYGNNLKTGGLFLYKGTPWAIVYESDTMCTTTVAGPVGVKESDSLVHVDSCGDTTRYGFTLWSPSPPPTYTVNISVTNGTSDKTGANSVDSNVQLVVTHAPDIHYHLTGITVTGTADTVWTSETEFRITPHSNCDVVITYGIDTFTVTEVPATGGTVTYNPDAEGSSPRSYAYGTVVHVTATPTADSAFVIWQGTALSSTSATDSFTVTDHVTLQPVFAPIPIIDSIRPNPQYRLDSCTIYLVGGGSAGVVRNITAGADVVQKYYSGTQIDIYTAPTWPRGWNMIQVTNADSLRDTVGLYISLPRKVTP